MEGDELPQDIFEDVIIATIPGDSLSTDQAFRLVKVVTQYGGNFVPRPPPGQTFDWDEVTHIISEDIDFPEYDAAIENGIHVVRPSWILQSIGKKRQAQPRQHSPDPSQYFRDVVLTCAGLADWDHDAIVAGAITLGGQYSGALSKLVTHIVTNDLNHEKCQVALEKGLDVKIVLPHWFDQCLTLGRLIKEKPYEFPDPDILHKDTDFRPRELPSPDLTGATTATPSGIPQSSPSPSPTEARKNLSAFHGRKVMLSADLHLTTHLYNTLDGLIYQGGGSVTSIVDEADIVICQYRDGPEYVQASRAGKEVGNLSWLYHVINRNKYSSPRNKLLHYPIPRHGIPGFENLKISVSNYSGEARIYIENLIRYSGAEFTKTMKQDNSHLITAHKKSEKCEAAEEWGVHVVNHIWLEESYAKCGAQSLTVPRYTCFPARTNLGEVAGQTSFDMRRVEKMFFAKPPTSPQKPTPRKTIASTTVHEDLPTPAPENDEETEDEQPQTTKKARGRPRKDAVTPHFRDEEKENESPLTHSTGRASKARAMNVMHAQADDIALFQKEMKRKGGVTHGRHSSLAGDVSSPVPAPPTQRKKRTSEESASAYDVTAEGSDLSDGETQHNKPAKKAKHAPTPLDFPPVTCKMMVTGDERWIANRNKESEDRYALRWLGVALTQDAKEVDILVAPKIMRTKKFIAAIAAAPKVVHSTFLDNVLKYNKIIDNPETLSDPEGESLQGFKLTEALGRAKVNQRKLLRGWTIFVTKDVTGGFDTYKEIITLNGGKALLYAGRTGLTLPKRRLRDDPEAGSESQHQGGDEEFDYVYLVSGKTEPEIKLWKTFRSLAEKQDLQARVVDTNWLLGAAMSQEIKWDPQWEFDENAVMSQRNG